MSARITTAVAAVAIGLLPVAPPASALGLSAGGVTSTAGRVVGQAADKSVVPVAFEGDPEAASVTVAPEADGALVTLDAAVYSPRDGRRHPAVILAHGFGGSRQDLDEAARELAGRGYVALAYSARGFGASGGLIHLMDPAVDGPDVSRLVDLLARRDDVLLDGAGDPRVGMSGASYGGAATLIGGGVDRRLDALVAGITWNDLADAFFPSSVAGDAATPADLAPLPTPGVFKRRWASQFFGSAVGASALPRGGEAPGGLPGGPPTGAATSGTSRRTPAAGALSTAAPLCGRFEPTLCRLFLAASTTGSPSPALLALLHRTSPARTNARLTAPTLLVQGMNDSLFGLDQSDANARQIAATGSPVAVRWFEGGHDGGAMPAAESTYLPWFDAYLRGEGDAAQRRAQPLPVEAFSFAAPAFRRGAPERDVTAGAYPGLHGAEPARPVGLRLADPERRSVLLSPPGGDPAATTAIPGLPAETTGALASAAYGLAALPGQSVAFDTEPVPEAITAVGAPTVRLSVTSSARDATLFVSFWKVVAGAATPARRQVAAVRVQTTPGVPTTVDVALPAGTFALDRGTTWRVLVSASDAAYATPTDARSYLVSPASPELVVATVPTAAEPAAEVDGEVIGLLIALGTLLAAVAGTAVFLRSRRRRGDAAHGRADLTDVPLSVSHLVKTYSDGHRAVDDVSWEARRGEVVGLLGPNGAGKTTTIRMIVGLIRPDSGEVHVHGRPVHAGSPALAGVGALIEGPGFLPHLSGRANLEAYWDATGRPRAEARFDEALDVAALGGAVERPVRSYSHGMRQRLGIAQAMLGMPEVLLLDEPTNGLDPPQIAAMRPVLRRYAETGRTVVVSSHLLAEVEMTCSHVIVMHRGHVVLRGSVDELVESADTTVLEVEGTPADAEELAAALRSGDVPGLHDVLVEPGSDVQRVVVHATGHRADVVAAAVGSGARVLTVSGRRHLEEVFLGVIAADDLDSARQVRPR